jgi:voltage-gated potassium channel
VANLLDAFVFALLAVAIATIFFRFINGIDLGRRGALARIKRMKEHVIIAPYNGFASALMKELKPSGVPFVVITDNEAEAHKLYEKKVPAIIGIVASSDAFRTAGIGKAKLVIACDDNDTQNALICVTAKSANPRIRLLSRVSRLDSIPKLSKAGAHRMILPEVVTGTKLGEEISKVVINASIGGGSQKEQPAR